MNFTLNKDFVDRSLVYQKTTPGARRRANKTTCAIVCSYNTSVSFSWLLIDARFGRSTSWAMQECQLKLDKLAPHWSRGYSRRVDSVWAIIAFIMCYSGGHDMLIRLYSTAFLSEMEVSSSPHFWGELDGLRLVDTSSALSMELDWPSLQFTVINPLYCQNNWQICGVKSVKM